MNKQIKLSVRISRELTFINVEEIEKFLEEHQWIKEKYQYSSNMDLNEIYDDLLDYLESKKERYSTLSQIVTQNKKQQNSELAKFVSQEFKEYNFLKKVDEIRESLSANKQNLQNHLQFILCSLETLIENQNNIPVYIHFDKFKYTKADDLINLLEFFGFIQVEPQKQGQTTLECQNPDVNFTQNAIVHLSDNLKEDLFYDEIQIQKEQERQKEIEKKMQSLNAHKHKSHNLYEFHKKQDINDQKQNSIQARVQEQIKAQLFKSRNPFLQRQGVTLSDAVQQAQRESFYSSQNANQNIQAQQQKNDIKIFDEFEKLAEKDIAKHINQYRYQLQLSALIVNEDISKVARNHSINMGLEKTSFGHENFSERKEVICQIYKKTTFTCENIFQYYTYLGIAKMALDFWKESHGNHENMISNSNYIGVGVKRNEKGIWYITCIICRIEE
ncbi:cysteine-rich secretory family protein (macronuclear) [Tetrahymena thermophila SB210]|uniref:Cysteine-rich secretory family protein n=1 Tax=Tetrahymena thermophila (strain SB210) TaxID=312017 RepID=I7LWI4_TETTS|nr:cysteine-rich secretory family protein [Tetrahymena thermophila SB210]EAS01946.2 cysteine-rich secretory family protein [Tetrahymena thermophila SB210]|eukprot:XP_001022191.2 cysteine-rich secretory family protein [Tetrahymena thermophila SB210]